MILLAWCLPISEVQGWLLTGPKAASCWVVTPLWSYPQYPHLLHHPVFTTFRFKNELAEITRVTHGCIHSCSSTDASALMVTLYQGLQVTAVFQFTIAHTEGSGRLLYILTFVGLCISVSRFCQYAASFHGSPRPVQAVPWSLAAWVFDTPYKPQYFHQRGNRTQGKVPSSLCSEFEAHRTVLSGSPSVVWSVTNKCSLPLSHTKTCRPANCIVYVGHRSRGRLWQSLRGISWCGILFSRSLEKLRRRGNRLRRKAVKGRTLSNKEWKRIAQIRRGNSKRRTWEMGSKALHVAGSFFSPVNCLSL